MRLALILLCVMCSACAQAQEASSPDSPPTIVGPDELLRLDGAVEGWPDLAATVTRSITVEGIVWIRVTVSATGELVATEVVRDFAPVITESALRTVHKLEFAPAMEAGEPIEGNLLVRVIYQLG
jgi:hypothetical protein